MTTSLCNLRDVGGTPLVGGGTVPYGVLYRGDAPIRGDGDPGLRPWPPGSVIDLRSDQERTLLGVPDFWAPSVPVLEISLMPDADPAAWEDHAGEPGPEVLCPMYAGMAGRGDLLVPVASAVATGPAPVFVHCAGGKDRTAVAVALLLEVAGAETEAIIADQLLSNEAVGRLRERFGRALGRPFGASVPHTLGEALLAALEVWRAHPDGAAGWLAGHGMARAEVAALRSRLRP